MSFVKGLCVFVCVHMCVLIYSWGYTTFAEENLIAGVLVLVEFNSICVCVLTLSVYIAYRTNHVSGLYLCFQPCH